MSLADQLTRMLQTGAERALWDLAGAVLEQAKADAPPEPPPGEDPDPNVSLRESGFRRRVPGGVEIGFDTPYAAKQHEDHRLEHPRGGGPKFLEKHVLAAAARLEGAIAGEIRAETAEHVATGGRRHTTRF